MRRILLMCVAIAAVALWQGPTAAQERSVLKRTAQLAEPLAAAAVATDLLQAEPLPAPGSPTPGVELIPTPQPTTTPTPGPAFPTTWVLEPRTYAVPTARWGIFGQRLIPKTVYVQRYILRPAQVSGPYYLIR